MKYSYVAVALATAVSAQSLSDIPSCAIPCIDSARQSATKCSETDYGCLCSNINDLTNAATPCVLQDCGATVAATEVLPAVQKFCEEVAAGGSSSATSAASSATSSAASSATSAASSATSAASSATSAVPSFTTPASNATMTTRRPTSAATTATSSGAESSATEVSTAGAAVAGSIGSLGMLVLGALAAF